MTLVRPIDGNALIEKIDKIDWYHVNKDGKLVSGAKNVSEAYFSALDIYDAVEYMPTIDVMQVVHGKWIEQPLKKYPEQYIPVCSVCEWKAFGKYNFCPHCGAYMDGDTNEID